MPNAIFSAHQLKALVSFSPKKPGPNMFGPDGTSAISAHIEHHTPLYASCSELFKTWACSVLSTHGRHRCCFYFVFVKRDENKYDVYFMSNDGSIEILLSKDLSL